MRRKKVIPDYMTIVPTLEKHGYHYKEPLGSGGMASVHLVHSIKYNLDFAAKVVLLNGHTSTGITMEMQSLVRLSHPNIIKVYDCFTDDEAAVMILEYCPNGTLGDRIRQGKLTVPEIKFAFSQIADALHFCHSRGIAHRDIKSANILIDANGRLKLADFGLSMFCKDGEFSSSGAGSLAYNPPEFFRKSVHDPIKSDIWSFGIVLYEMATGNLPWRSKTASSLKHEILQGIIVLNPYEIDPEVISVLEKVLTVEPHKRATSEELKSMSLAQRAVAKSSPKLPLLKLDGVAGSSRKLSTDQISSTTSEKNLILTLRKNVLKQANSGRFTSMRLRMKPM